MFHLKVEMFGIPAAITSEKDVEVTLNDGAMLPDLVAALRQAIPAFNGEVVRRDTDILGDSYTFNLNGHFYAGCERIVLNPGDSVKLLLMATGG